MYETIIIGAGIAGCTAALYASRKRMKYLVVAKEFGGQFLESGDILNYPGIPKTHGAEFRSMFEEQLKLNNIEPKTGEEVRKIEPQDEGFAVSTDKEAYEAKTVIIATGSRPRRLDVPGEKEFANKGVTYCAVCDGPLFSDKDIAIIGAGNSALEAVDFTKEIAKRIYLINLRENLSAHEGLVEKVNSYSNVEIINEAATREILGDEMVKGLKYERRGETNELKVDGVIVEVGRTPNTGFVEGLLELDEHNHIVIDCQTNTSTQGVFAAGDCASGKEYQYAIAAGQGCMALLKTARYLAAKP